MAINDRIMDDMVASEKSIDTGGQKIDLFNNEPLVPRVDKHVGKKRWGADTPMFDNREDMHGFLQSLGMAPGGLGADFLDAALYMSEGEFQEALISMGAAVPILGAGVTAGRKGYKLLGRTAKERRAKEFKEGLAARAKEYDISHAREQAGIAEDLSLRKAERHWDKIDTKIAIDKVARQTGDLTRREKGLLDKWESDEAAKVARFIKNQTPAEKAAYEKMKLEVMEKLGISERAAARNVSPKLGISERAAARNVSQNYRYHHQRAADIRKELSNYGQDSDWTRIHFEQDLNYAPSVLAEAKEKALKSAKSLYGPRGTNDPKKLKQAIEMIEGEGSGEKGITSKIVDYLKDMF